MILGKIDQVVAVRSRNRPAPDRQSTVILPDQLLYVRGWAVGSTHSSFEVALDDGVRSPCATGFPRPDVAQSLRIPDAAGAGLDAFIEVPALDDGSHRLALLAIEGQRIETLDVVSVQVLDPRPRTPLRPLAGGQFEVDRIRAGIRDLGREARALVVEPDEIITIEGWAINGLEVREGVALYAVIDEREAVRAVYGRERADVAEALGAPRARFSGFRITIDPGPYATGMHVVRIVVLMEDGSAYGCADTFALCLKS